MNRAKDEVPRPGRPRPRWRVAPAARAAGCALAALLIPAGCRDGGPGRGVPGLEQEVVLYVALDQVYSQPVLDEFEARTRIRVRAVFDAEAVKTVGLVNRILAERGRPQADVFWNNEVVRTLVLKERGALAAFVPESAAGIPDEMRDPDGFWHGFAARARVIVYNTRQIAARAAPRTTFDLSHPQWRGRVALAYPLFGTTATHAAALTAYFGAARTRALFKDLLANDVLVEAGNSVVRDRVAQGAAWVGWTDTDDVYAGQAQGKPVAMVLPDQDGMGALVIPNTVALIAGAPHPVTGRRLIEFLLSVEVEEMLARGPSRQIPVRAQVPVAEGGWRLDAIRVMSVDWPQVLAVLEPTGQMMEELFGR